MGEQKGTGLVTKEDEQYIKNQPLRIKSEDFSPQCYPSFFIT